MIESPSKDPKLNRFQSFYTFIIKTPEFQQITPHQLSPWAFKQSFVVQFLSQSVDTQEQLHLRKRLSDYGRRKLKCREKNEVQKNSYRKPNYRESSVDKDKFFKKFRFLLLKIQTLSKV
ncbi:hypothetical protein DQM68_15785 [Leptospira mayottensis]|uniref:DUF1564 family protein n=1 Tax=Leptospira mayottensis TaxID=1137606 RepID=A0ABM6YCT8_9LEPT|nr:hypothetical protein DQM68_15785 [Leptospira mayottensis]AXR65831.1 hypothetical protein DQM28_18105 [Leptospira mayottensis]